MTKLVGVFQNVHHSASGQTGDGLCRDAMVDMMTSLKGNDKMRHALESEVRKDLHDACVREAQEKTPDDRRAAEEEKNRLGLIASTYAKTAETPFRLT